MSSKNMRASVLPQQRDTECLVYRVTDNAGLGVRSQPAIDDRYRTSKSFEKGDLVSVDFVEKGNFLHLSDDTGWLFIKKYESVVMEPLDVTSGLWAFYVQNYPAGLGLRWHPMDRTSVRVSQMVNGPVESESTTIVLKPYQKVYCDRKVIDPDSGVNFYRMQGTRAWIFDQRGDYKLLLSEDQVHTGGLFAYQLCGGDDEGSEVRAWPTVKDSARTQTVFWKNQIVVTDMKIMSNDADNGPFVRLTDGRGWLFERKNGQKCLEPVSIHSGSWTFQILNNVGLKLRAQPIDQGKQLDTLFEYGSTVDCDREIQGVNGIKYYRVKGTDGWLFDTRDGVAVLRLIRHKRQPEDAQCGWSPDFVRGIAAGFGLEEIFYNPQSRLISFRHTDGERINVYYTTQTVGTALNHPTQGKIQLFRRDCTLEELISILRNPHIHTNKGWYQHKPKYVGRNQFATDINDEAILLEKEERLRNELVECDLEFERLKERRSQLWKEVLPFDQKRESIAAQSLEQTIACLQRIAEQKQKTCEKCNKVFGTVQAMEQHVESVHNLGCPVCYRVFVNQHAKKQHCDATGHY